MAWTTIINRLLGPGSRSELIGVALDLINTWNTLERSLGFEFDSRVFGAIICEEESIDSAFLLPPLSDPILRGRTVSNFFWPRGAGSTRLGSNIADPFGLLPPVDRENLRELLGPQREPMSLLDWGDAERDRVHSALVKHGEVAISFQPESERLARRVILALQEEPIDVGAIFSHPTLIGVEYLPDDGIKITMILAEIT